MFLRIGVFYVLTWFFLILLGGLQEASGILPPQIGLAQWGPGIAALLVVAIFRKDGVKITFYSKETPLLRYLLAALIPAGVGFFVFLLRSVIPIEADSLPDVYNSMGLVLLWTPLGALGEELGWRGYLHKKLDTRFRGLISSVIVGVLWMPIHLSLLAQGSILLIFMALWFVSVSVVIYGLAQDTDFNVLVAAIFHMTINFINLLIIDVMYQPSFWALNGFVWMIVAFIFISMKRELYLGAK